MKGVLVHGPNSRSWRVWLGGLLVAASVAAALPGAAQARVVGTIQFGRNYRDAGSSFAIVGAKQTFGPRERMAYIAHIPNGPGTHKMTVAFYLKSGGTLSFVSKHAWDVKNVRDTEFANRYTLAAMADYGIVRPGTYVMRFTNGKILLAQGTFIRTR